MPLASLPHLDLMILEGTAVVLILVGMLVSLRCLRDALQRRAWVRRSSINGVRRVLARRDVRSESITCIVQLVLLTVSIIGVIGAPTDEGRVFHAFAGSCRAAISLFLAYGSWGELRDRHIANRLLAEGK